MIRQEIENNTEYGQKLVKARKNKALNINPYANDRFGEFQFSPVHFDIVLVCELLKSKIAEIRQN